jgi:hypothetical protein
MNKEKPNAKQEQAIVLLLSGHSVTETAQELSIERGTIYNLLKETGFKTEYYSARKILNEQSKNSLMNLNISAINTIKGLLESQNDVVKLKAAMYLLDNLKTTDEIQLKEQENFKLNSRFGFGSFE